MTASRWKWILYTLSELGGIGMLGLLFYYLHWSGAAQLNDVWSLDRVVAYTLLFAGSVMIFVPCSMALKLGPLWLLGAGSWTLLGYVLIFVGPPDRGSAPFLTYAAFLALVLVALSSALAIPLGAFSARLLSELPGVGGLVRALRQGGLLSLFAVTLLAMSPLGVLNWLNALLVFTIVSLTEFFFLARN